MNQPRPCWGGKHVATAGPTSMTDVGYEDSTAAAVPTAYRTRVQVNHPPHRTRGGQDDECHHVPRRPVKPTVTRLSRDEGEPNHPSKDIRPGAMLGIRGELSVFKSYDSLDASTITGLEGEGAP